VGVVGTFYLYTSCARSGSSAGLFFAMEAASDTGRLPTPAAEWALFLDVDGTLLDLAETPLAVTVPVEVVALLARLQGELEGAVALVSGRSLETLDRLFWPLHLPAAGQHGLERRDAFGAVTRRRVAAGALDRVRRRLSGIEGEVPGVLIEDKGDTLAVHYRLAPESEPEVASRVADAVRDAGSLLELITGKKVLEVRPRNAGKDKVVEAFMAEAPFRGRTPVFVGDDRTDEDGFAAVNRLGGHSILVGGEGASAARHRIESAGDVRVWLAAVAAAIAAAKGRASDGAARSSSR
jgi:trehalose 6-phosphate phosphatase